MCQHGQDRICSVWVCAEDSHTGQGRWADKSVDACLADLVNALNAVGSMTRSCCCGHGKGAGSVLFHDGTSIVVHIPPSAAPERTVPESAWCRLVCFVKEPEPPEVKAELDAKEIIVEE